MHLTNLRIMLYNMKNLFVKGTYVNRIFDKQVIIDEIGKAIRNDESGSIYDLHVMFQKEEVEKIFRQKGKVPNIYWNLSDNKSIVNI